MDYLIEHINEILIVILVACIVVLLLGILWPRNLFKSSNKPLKSSFPFGFFRSQLGVYYLPETVLGINVKTTVIVEIDQNNKINSQQVTNQDFRIKQLTRTNYRRPFYLTYLPNPFSDEEVELVLDKNKLLENVSSSSNSRLDDIVFSLSDFNSNSINDFKSYMLFNRKRNKKPMRLLKREFKRYFEIPLHEITKDAPKEQSWDIMLYLDEDVNISTKISAGFKIKSIYDDSIEGESLKNFRKIKGLVFPLNTALNLQVVPMAKNLESSEFELSCIHPNKYFSVPLKTTPFAHRKHSLKISNGHLMEHHVSNPSSVVGFASIPVRVAKSIISIPAQLFSIQLRNFKAEAELEKTSLQHEKDLTDLENEFLVSKIELNKTKKYIDELKNDSNSEIDRLNSIIQRLRGK
jgi:hypothetical protein